MAEFLRRERLDREPRGSKRSATGKNHFSAEIDELIGERARQTVTILSSVESPNGFNCVYAYILSERKRPVECG